MATTPLSVKVQTDAPYIRRVLRQSLREMGIEPQPAHRAHAACPVIAGGKHRAEVAS